ncbi:hypothetical protein AURDEDRAFT_189087 [Auricularia subglabra TFB-10046 SS5]|uniref:Uncharacterized protein n=1 Tax=Auricularia subglabra (strain TFB-10046 / SS5) TaxID=717982 RepID=J0LA77_AURST|nr:hypothetical protein AURDEDRAFT_189087 [Auricularia subglabra TFB-10046 SS5]
MARRKTTVAAVEDEVESFTHLFRWNDNDDTARDDGSIHEQLPHTQFVNRHLEEHRFTDASTGTSPTAAGPATEFGLELIDIVSGFLADMPDVESDDAEIARWARTELRDVRMILGYQHDDKDDVEDAVAELKGVFDGIKRDIADLKKLLLPDSEPESPAEPRPRESDPEKLLFNRLIRDHMDALLPADESGRRAAALPSDVFSFENGIGVGPRETKFSVDMDPTRLHLSKWNTAAAVIFADSFLRTHKGRYSKAEVMGGFYTNMRAVQNRQRIAMDGLSALDVENMRRNRVSRRQWTLFNQRLFVVMHFQSLKDLISVMNTLGPGGMSPDSSDSESVVRTNHPDRPAYRRHRVKWRSAALTKILHQLDVLYHYLKTVARASGRSAGNWPRLRVDTLDGLDLAVGKPVSRLPVNCYDSSWCRSLDEDALFWLKPARSAANLTLNSELQRYEFQ